jgi:hypothetical protein
VSAESSARGASREIAPELPAAGVMNALSGYTPEDFYCAPELGDRNRRVERSVPPWT